MSNFNLRLYGEQLYPNISKYLTKYISPEIPKEEFLSSYKSGSLQIKSIKLIEKISIHPQIQIEELNIDELNIKIPDEKENMEIHINNIKCYLSISELNETEIEKIIINERKEIIDEFIKYAISKIEKKDGPSFLDNIIKSVIEKILNGFTISINQLELKIFAKAHNNIFFIFNIGSADFICDKGINIKNMSIIYQEDLMKKTVIEKFDFNIDITFKDEEKKIENKLYASISDFKLEINKNIYFEFFYLLNIFEEAEYKKVYLIYKKLIQYHRPKLKDDGKIDYKSLWKYGIKTVINLQKYVQKNEENIFDLKYLTQIKIIKDYLDNKQKEENLLLIDMKKALKCTKENVEKKVLENKKGNFFAKFSFFFGKKEEEKKEELTEEEQELSSQIYEEENIKKYLKKELNLNTTSLSSIFDKVKLYFTNFSTEILFGKLELILHNSSNTQNFFIKGMKTNFNYFNKEFDFGFFINDIGYDEDKSFLEKNDIFCGDVITLTKDKNNFINLNFGFSNIELNEELFVFLLSFGKSIKREKRIKLFHEKKEGKNNELYDKEEIIKNIQNFSLLNNFKLSNIPSFSIKSKENQIYFKISNYSINENSINFNLDIRDTHSIILNNFNFNPKKEGNKFIFHLDSPLEINLLSESSKIFFLNYLKYQKEISSNNSNNNSSNKSTKKEKKELFGFNYKSYTNIDLGKLNMNDYILDIIINKIDIKIFEEKENYQSNFVLEDFRFLYQNKNLDINLNKIIISTNLMSTIILYFIDFESPLLEEYKKNANLVAKDVNDILSMASAIEIKDKDDKKDLVENNLQIQNQINYSKLLEEILNEFTFNLNILGINYQSDNFVLSLNLNKIKAFKKNEENAKISLCSSIENWNINIESPKINVKNKKIIENNKTFLISYEFNEEIIRGELKSIYLNTKMEEIMDIFDNTKYLLNQINWDIILCKMDFKVEDFVLILDQFQYSISKILFINFKEKCDKDNAFYITFLDFLMRNQKGNQIIYEKKLCIDYLFTSSTENDITINFNGINVEISQHDITFLISSIKFPKKKEEDNLQRKNTFAPNISSVKNNVGNQIDFINNDSKILKQKISTSDKSMGKKKKFTLSLFINIPKLNLCFCLNDYSKIEEISIESSNIKMKNVFYENILSNEPSNDLTYNMSFGKLNFVFYYKNQNAVNILSKRNIIDENNNNDNNIIKGEKDNKSQVEIICDSNKYLININQNEVNVRLDVFIMIYYYFKGALPIEEIMDNLDKIDLNINKQKKIFHMEINFNESEFQLCTSFSGKENLFLDINKFQIIYIGYNNIPYGSYNINLSKITAKISVKNNIRDLFFTNEEFLRIKLTFAEELLSIFGELETLKINLSYRDLISFLRVYILNFQMIDDNIKQAEEFLKNREKINSNNINNKKEIKKSLNKGESTTPNSLINKKLAFTGELSFQKLDITLIDNSKGSYHPFMNIINNKIIFILNPDNSIEATFDIQLFSYNYIARIWEPTIQKTNIRFNYLYIQNKVQINNKLKMEIDNIIINLSDMAISFTLISLNNWFEKFSKKRKKFQTDKIDNEQMITTEHTKEISKITNNQVINYTGIEFKIIHNGQLLDCPPIKPVELDYINNYSKSKSQLTYITLIYDEKNKFEIPLEKIITLKHTLNNGVSFVSDNVISENRTINIILCSTIMFKNKSIYPLQITVQDKGSNLVYLVLNPNCITGIPLNLVNQQNYFNFIIITEQKNTKEKDSSDYSQNFNIGGIKDINTDFEYKDYIKFKKRYLLMKLTHKIHSVRTLIINSEYSIVNCLPCNLTVHFSSKKETIKKCTQYYIDEFFGSKLYVALSINTEFGEFKSEGFDLLSLGLKKTEEKFLKFTHNKLSFKLLYDFKQNEEENTLIIFAEYIFYNKTDIPLSVYSKDKNNEMLFFGIEKNISLITSKFDYNEAYFQLLNENFISFKVKISSLIEKSPYSEIEMRSEKGDKLKINVKKKISYINIINNKNFKDNIMSMIFTCFPSCIITNLLPNKRFYICDYQFQNNYQIINPYHKNNFFFFGHGSNTPLGISILNMESNKCTHLIKFKFNIGIYTLSTIDETFNIEIRKNPSNGCLDVYVIQNDLENSKIIMENLSGEGIIIYQKNYEKYMQILENNQIKTLKMYNFESPDFTIETSNSVYDIKFNRMEEQEKTIELNKKILLLIQANGIKMKLIFYPINKYKQLKTINNINTFEFRINSIELSLIGDNEFQDNKLTNYHRYELLWLKLTELSMNLSIETTSGVLSKNSIKYIFNLTNLQIYNQVSEKGKFPQIFENKEALLSLYSEFDYYDKLKIIKMKTNNLFIGKIELGIDPEFIIELVDFFGNIFYRMDITNFIVHELFQKNKNKKEKEKIDSLIKEYAQSRILLNAKNFEIPEINIKFEITKLGLKDLLKERIGCSEFYYWLAKGLVGNRYNLKLESSRYPYNNGGLGNFFKELLYHIRAKFETKLIEIGLKGLVGKVTNLFSNDDSKKKMNNNITRKTRAFYGKFKYFRDYDQREAIYINDFFAKNKYYNNKYYPLSVVFGFSKFYLFTTISLFIIEYKKYAVTNIIDYFYIKKVIEDKLEVKIEYNQIIESTDNCTIPCEDETIAKNVAKSLNEEIINNKEFVNEI